MIELLAPAKDKFCAKAAIDCGADALYIGANKFGARKNAFNTVKDIEEIVKYAHKFNAKVYVAINTILTDKEIEEAKNLIKKLKEINVDAIIIQDMGLLEYIKSLNMGVFASTQCDNRKAEKVEFLEFAGFERAILARELSIEQIKEIKKHTNIELETFIHGALCVSYSGQCYLSYAIGKRSANKGVCAQPCRKKYSLADENGNFIEKDKYLLCLKDFNASDHIKELVEAGITSFKIEGRLKDINYVRNTVAYYRNLIDKLGYKKTSSGRVLLDFEPNLEKSFNRGFTDYFLDGKRKAIYEFESPKSKGEYLGEVVKIEKDFFEINSTQKLNHQDGLCFYNKGELFGCLINRVEKNNIYPNKMEGINVGTEIYRNFDSEFEKKLSNTKTCRKISANILFEFNKISAQDEEGNYAEIKYEYKELAQKKESMFVNIISQFKKSGNSIFSIEQVDIDTDKMPFLTVAELNELRRNLLENLEQERLKNYKKTDKNIEIANISYPQKEIDYRGNVLNQSAKDFYKKHGCKVVEPALESGSKCTGKIVMTTKHCLKHAFNMCKSPKKLYLIDEKGKKYPLQFNCQNCEMEIIF